MVLLDGSGNQPADSDSVATHLDGPFATFGIEISRAHGDAVFGAEIKNLTDFDAAMRFEDSRLAARTWVAGHG